MRAFLFSIACSGVLFAYPLQTNAQEMTNVIDGVEVLTILTTPELVRPYETFTIQPESTLISLAEAKLRFFINGVLVSESQGKSAFSATAPAPGSSMVIKVTAETFDEFYEKQIVITPQDVVLVMEPSSTIPPGYRGAALLPAQSETRIVAMASFKTTAGVTIPASELIYSWQAGTRELEDFSGTGRSVLTVEGPLRYRSETISVYVTTKDKRFAAYAQVAMEPVTPFVRMYRADPLIGTLSVPAIGTSLTMKSEEETLVAAPFFFRSTPSLVWTVDGVNGGIAPKLTVRSSGAGDGSATVAIEASDSSTLSAVRATTQVLFGTSARTPFFDI